MSGPELVEPERNADEWTTLTQFLDWYRVALRQKAEGLTAAEMTQTVGRSPLTVGSIINHMAYVEAIWFVHRFAGSAFPEPWGSAPWDTDPDWEFHSAAAHTPDELLERFDESIAASRAILEGASLDDQAARLHRDGSTFSLRWILVHLIEEYARHAGHLDMLRESIDGSVGD